MILPPLVFPAMTHLERYWSGASITPFSVTVDDLPFFVKLSIAHWNNKLERSSMSDTLTPVWPRNGAPARCSVV